MRSDALHGVWSHGQGHGYYGGSHDFRLVFLPNGLGSYTHDGWVLYRYCTFTWRLGGTGVVDISNQQYYDAGNWGKGVRLLQLERRPVLVDFDPELKSERLKVPFMNDEPSQFWLVTRDSNETLQAYSPSERIPPVMRTQSSQPDAVSRRAR